MLFGEPSRSAPWNFERWILKYSFQTKALASKVHERGTQTEERAEDGLEQGTIKRKEGEEGEMVKEGLVVLVKNKGEGEQEEEEMVKRMSSDLGRKITLSKSFSRLLSFRRAKK